MHFRRYRLPAAVHDPASLQAALLQHYMFSLAANAPVVIASAGIMGDLHTLARCAYGIAAVVCISYVLSCISIGLEVIAQHASPASWATFTR